jgi:pantoate--beta-alanine ligase
MGYLHEGHLSLVRLLEGVCDVKAASIFVNPMQFGPAEDIARYPRNEKRDLELLEQAGCSLAFCPSVEDIYPEDFQTHVEVEELQKPLCGEFRPGHFRGVATVVLKLFNITGCDAAAFGLKDYQQAKVIERMVRDLNVPVKLLFGETLRDSDGLAKSSRNAYLSPEQRQVAQAIPRALESASAAVRNGERDAVRLAGQVRDQLESAGVTSIQYIEIFHPDTLLPLTRIESSARMAVALYIGNTRLIDNILLA